MAPLCPRDSSRRNLRRQCPPSPFRTPQTEPQRQGAVGKILLDLRVTDLQGNRITFGRASLRNLCRSVSAAGIGYLLAQFTKERKRLHDFLASCRVVGPQNNCRKNRPIGFNTRSKLSRAQAMISDFPRHTSSRKRCVEAMSGCSARNARRI